MRVSLLEDGSLALRVEPAVSACVEPWLPRIPLDAAPADHAALIHVEPGPPLDDAPDLAPALELRALGGWVLPAAGRVVLRDAAGAVSARVDLAAHRATVRIAEPGSAAAHAVEIFGALTLSAALLLTRLERALLHAAAVVAPDGRAWLLAAGSFGGKTTTTLNLVRRGWDYLSDDHVVLRAAPDGGVGVEGWPRRFNLDHGYWRGASSGVRSRVDPEGLGAGRWRRSAPLGGLLFTRVEAGLPTELTPLHPADALGRLLDQSPWLLADAPAAPAALRLLQRAAGHPAHAVRLGQDCFCDASRLQMFLASAAHPAEGA